MKFVTFYLMEWQNDLSEGFGFETEKILWLTIEEAYEMLNNKNEKEIIKAAKIMFDKLNMKPNKLS